MELDGVGWGDHVDVQRVQPVICVTVRQRRHRREPGIVDEYVQRTELLLECSEGSRHCLPIGYVCRKRQSLAARRLDLRGQVFQPIKAPCHQRDAHTHIDCKRAGDFGPDSAGSPRHERNAAAPAREASACFLP